MSRSKIAETIYNGLSAINKGIGSDRTKTLPFVNVLISDGEYEGENAQWANSVYQFKSGYNIVIATKSPQSVEYPYNDIDEFVEVVKRDLRALVFAEDLRVVDTYIGGISAIEQSKETTEKSMQVYIDFFVVYREDVIR